MNAFKKNEKPTHKLYSSAIVKKEFVTNKEFVQDLSVDSVDLSLSFSGLEESFFSKGSSKDDEGIMKELRFEIEKVIEKDQEEVRETVVVRKNREEDTNYTCKPVFASVKLEKEEFARGWFCQNCEIVDSGQREKKCVVF